jgi:hypothetical protein
MNKPTICRGVKIVPGSITYYIVNEYRFTRDPFENNVDIMGEQFATRIESREVKATNGSSIAFVRSSHGDKGPWRWMVPDDYLLTREEAEAALEAALDGNLDYVRALARETAEEIARAQERLTKLSNRVSELEYHQRARRQKVTA